MTSTGWFFLIAGVIVIVWLVSKSRNSTKSNEAKVRQQWLEQGDKAGYQRVFDHPVCDICSKPINITECYALTTEQVVTKEVYWNFAFTHQWSYVHDKYPDGDIIFGLAQQQAGQSTAWYTCEACSASYQFDREASRRFVESGLQHLPGGGTADINRTALAAASVWKKLYGAYPSSIIVK